MGSKRRSVCYCRYHTVAWCLGAFSFDFAQACSELVESNGEQSRTSGKKLNLSVASMFLVVNGKNDEMPVFCPVINLVKCDLYR